MIVYFMHVQLHSNRAIPAYSNEHHVYKASKSFINHVVRSTWAIGICFIECRHFILHCSPLMQGWMYLLRSIGKTATTKILKKKAFRKNLFMD